MAGVRRLISLDAPLNDTNRDAIPDVVARLLESIGVASHEARSLAAAAHHAERSPTKHDSATA